MKKLCLLLSLFLVPGHKGHTALTPHFGGVGHGSQSEEKNYLEAADPGFKEALLQLNTRPQTISEDSQSEGSPLDQGFIIDTSSEDSQSEEESDLDPSEYLKPTDPGFKEALLQLNNSPQTISDFSLQSQNSQSEKKYDLSPGGKKDAPPKSSSGRSWFATIGDDNNSPPNSSSGRSWFAKM